MSNYQYCECGAGLNPTFEDALNGIDIQCGCGRITEIAYREEMIHDGILQMFKDIQELKKWRSRQNG